MFANYDQTVKRFVSNDQGFLFMNQIKGTPTYWKKFQREVLAMVKQLGCPIFFLTLSCADLRWNELVEIISKLNSLAPTKENVGGLNYFEKCNILNANAVLLARHFQHRVEIFFTEILIIRNGPFEPNSELIDSLLLEISKQDQEENLYDDRQEHDNQEIGSSEHESSIGQSQR